MGDVVAFGFIAFGVAVAWSTAWAFKKVREADERAFDARIAFERYLDRYSEAATEKLRHQFRQQRRVRWPSAQWQRV